MGRPGYIFWPIPRNRAMRNAGTGFVVLSHHSLFHQCSIMFYAAWKICLSATDCVCISGLVFWGLPGALPQHSAGGRSLPDPLCSPYLQTLCYCFLHILLTHGVAWWRSGRASDS